jgi:hypothetical protein
MNHEFYLAGIAALDAARLPFLVGGAHAMKRYAAIERDTKDFDIFVHPRDAKRTLTVLADAGYRTEMTFPHWIGKAFCGEDFIDVIFSSGNGVAEVDDIWFEHAVDDILLGVPVKLCPVEEMIWSKAFVMERERYDGADIAHLLRSHASHLDWQRLLDRFGAYWRVLFSHLVLFGFIYPSERAQIPQWVVQSLIARLQEEMTAPPPRALVCRGTLLSREQYLQDIEQSDFEDPRLRPTGKLSAADVERWTAPVLESSEPETKKSPRRSLASQG